MSRHFNTSPGWPQTRAEVDQLDNTRLELFMAACEVDPGEPEVCLACYAFDVVLRRADPKLLGVPSPGPMTDEKLLYDIERVMGEAYSRPVATLMQQLDAALGLVRELVDPDECHYDHHDYCQTHSLDPRPCPHSRARELLGQEAQT